jgi:3-dehydroquinate synthase
MHMHATVAVDYPVHFAHRCLSPSNAVLADMVARLEPARRHRCVAVVDSGVAAHQPDVGRALEAYSRAHTERMVLVAPVELGLGGEACKNDAAIVTRLQAWLDENRIDRQSCVIAIGGGALLDLVGYAAGTFHRGVRVLRVPTTVLAQADSAIGVKNGVNAFGKKNALGTFAPPHGVLIDPTFLTTLPRRDWIAGMAEAVKVALLASPAFFRWILARRARLAALDPLVVARLVRCSAGLHLRHIATCGDPFEGRSARPLDFGHWAAHRLEVLSGHRLRHGEAVAIGMVIDTLYAVDRGIASEAFALELIDCLRSLGLPSWDPALEIVGRDGRLAVLQGLAEFREHLGGDLSVVFVREPGAQLTLNEVDEAAMVRAIGRLSRMRCGAAGQIVAGPPDDADEQAA